MTTPNVAYGVYNGYAPKNGPKAMTFNLEFTAAVTELLLNLYIEEAAKQIEFVQSIFIDNSQSAVEFAITTQITQQTLRVPPGNQAILPLFAIDQTNLTAQSTGEETVSIILLNVPLGPAVWGPCCDAVLPEGAATAANQVLAIAALNTLIAQTAAYEFENIATATTTDIAASELGAIVVNSLGTVASAVEVYDGTAGAGTLIAIIDSLNQVGTFTFNVALATGLSIVTTGTVAPNVTATYRT